MSSSHVGGDEEHMQAIVLPIQRPGLSLRESGQAADDTSLMLIPDGLNGENLHATHCS